MTGVQTCALPICGDLRGNILNEEVRETLYRHLVDRASSQSISMGVLEPLIHPVSSLVTNLAVVEIGRASCRERV